ncbi:hypothetical protein Cni_G17055 [Canna indica]|uniref:CBS domain-containing protein n=1 Tax=Canna indica TaxID=4628 RepID=A0AAQ3KHS2_9LILI|nr:hypothetical protein Cni_G17055 [Canna indica]
MSRDRILNPVRDRILSSFGVPRKFSVHRSGAEDFEAKRHYCPRLNTGLPPQALAVFAPLSLALAPSSLALCRPRLRLSSVFASSSSPSKTTVSSSLCRADVPAGKQKNVAVEDAKYRRALGDIGNLVNLRVSEGSFRAQLLANAQAAAAPANKKPVPVATQPHAAVRRGGIKPAKKVTTKVEDIDIIVISPDDNEKWKQAADPNGSCLKYFRKKSSTLTSVLTARSKMTQHNVGALVVLKPGDEKLLAGIVTERDYLRKIIVQGKPSTSMRVKDIMTDENELITVNSDTNIMQAMQLMTDNHIRHVPVIDKRLVGMISIVDVVRIIVEQQLEEIHAQ